jgi:hypothetical protein
MSQPQVSPAAHESLFGDVAPPAGAVPTFAWQLDGNCFRDFEGTTRRGEPARVQIFGRQQADGSTRPWIAVHLHQLDALDAAATRELAAALTDAGNEIERLG